MKTLLGRRDDPLERMYDQVKGLDRKRLLPGLTVLTKDTAAFLVASGIDDETTEGFRLAYLDMLGHNRYYWELFGPELYLPLRDVPPKGLPEGFASAAASCEADLRPLLDCDLKKEWLRAPGWHFFQAYSRQRRERILCGKSLEAFRDAFCEGVDPCAPASKTLCDNKDPFKPVAATVERLAGSERQANRFWHPVMLYLVLLLYKTNFITLE